MGLEERGSEGCGLDSYSSVYGPVAVYCEHGSEYSASIKDDTLKLAILQPYLTTESKIRICVSAKAQPFLWKVSSLAVALTPC